MTEESPELWAKVIELLPRAKEVWEENPPPPATPDAIATVRRLIKISA